MRSLIRSIAIAALGAAAGCAKDSPTAPTTSSSPLDISALISQMGAGSAGAAVSATAVAGVPGISAAGSMPTVPTNCAYSASSGAFVCPPFTFAGITTSLTYYLYDAAGHPLSQADPSKTASIRTVADTKGASTSSFNGTSFSNNTADHSDMTMSGLLTNAHTLNGTSKTHFDFTASGKTSSHSVMDGTSVTANLQLPAKPGPNAWPLSGTVTSDLASTIQFGTAPSTTFAVHTVLTYTGTSTATLATTINGVTHTCKVDLTGKTLPVC